MNIQNTKTIAHMTDMSTGAVNATARDLGIEMVYRVHLKHWEIVNAREAQAFADMLMESNGQPEYTGTPAAVHAWCSTPVNA